ncbi:MAG: hypothetical protein RR956_04750 [Christensenella sp.]
MNVIYLLIIGLVGMILLFFLTRRHKKQRIVCAILIAAATAAAVVIYYVQAQIGGVFTVSAVAILCALLIMMVYALLVVIIDPPKSREKMTRAAYRAEKRIFASEPEPKKYAVLAEESIAPIADERIILAEESTDIAAAEHTAVDESTDMAAADVGNNADIEYLKELIAQHEYNLALHKTFECLEAGNVKTQDEREQIKIIMLTLKDKLKQSKRDVEEKESVL